MPLSESWKRVNVHLNFKRGIGPVQVECYEHLHQFACIITLSINGSNKKLVQQCFSIWREKVSNVDVGNSFHILAMVQERLAENSLWKWELIVFAHIAK